MGSFPRRDPEHLPRGRTLATRISVDAAERSDVGNTDFHGRSLQVNRPMLVALGRLLHSPAEPVHDGVLEPALCRGRQGPGAAWSVRRGSAA